MFSCAKNTHHILANNAALHGCEYPKYVDPTESTEQFEKEKQENMADIFKILNGGANG